MEEVYKIFKEIKNTSGKNDKIKIIKQHKDNKLFIDTLVFLLDGNITTGISKKKMSKAIKLTDGNRIRNFEDCMNYVSVFNTGRDEDVAQVQHFILRIQDEKLQEFVKEIVTKSYKLGADKKLVNTAIPNLIESHDVQLGTSIEHCKIKEGTWFSISHKLNGCRCSFIKNALWTRQGKKYTGVNHIIEDLNKLGLSNMFVDGELVYKNNEGLSDSEAFQVGTGIANSKADKKDELKLVIFDMFPLEEYIENQESKDTYKIRVKAIEQLKDTIDKRNDIKNVEIVNRFYEGTDQSQIWKWLQYAEDNDLEGIMINLDSKYVCKRTKNLIKVKKFYTYDLRVIDVVEGEGRLKGTLGALTVEYKDNTINVGSGYDDATRKRIWDNKDDMIGKIIEVKFKEETIDKKTGKHSLQFPVYISTKLDKDDVSYE